MISYATFGNIYLALLWLVIFQFLHIFTGATAPVHYPRICLSEQMFFFHLESVCLGLILIQFRLGLLYCA